jgi:hypothetical protein
MWVLDDDGLAGPSDVVGLVLLAVIHDGQPAAVGEVERNCAVLLGTECLYRGPQESHRSSRKLRRTCFRLPDPLFMAVKVGKLALDRNSHVFIEAELNLVNANGDLPDFPSVQKAQVDVST